MASERRTQVASVVIADQVLAMTLIFPFERDREYSIRELRSFERALLFARQNDPEISASWRVPSTPHMKRCAKIREETYPIKLMADHKEYPDDTSFRLAVSGHPGVDARIQSGGLGFDLQITIADPIWRASAKSLGYGGYDHRLTMEALNADGVVVGSAGIRRTKDGRIVSSRPVHSFEEEFEACRLGLVLALRRKISDLDQSRRLLTYARGYELRTLDFTFASVVSAAVEAVGLAAIKSAFHACYFVNERDYFFLEE
jgi:hypothetical protein